MAFNDTFTVMVPSEIEEASGYRKWEESLDGSLLVRIQAAREKIVSEGVITSVKNLGDGLHEKKWKSGLRLYFAVVEKEGGKIVLLLGSGKGAEQDYAIKRSKKLLQTYRFIRFNLVKKD